MTEERKAEIKDEFARNQSVCQNVIGLFHLLSNKARFRIEWRGWRGADRF